MDSNPSWTCCSRQGFFVFNHLAKEKPLSNSLKTQGKHPKVRFLSSPLLSPFRVADPMGLKTKQPSRAANKPQGACRLTHNGITAQALDWVSLPGCLQVSVTRRPDPNSATVREDRAPVQLVVSPTPSSTRARHQAI